MPLNATQAAMIGLLHDGPMTGGDLTALANKWLAPYWNTTRSQIYRELPALEAQRYIKAGPTGSRNSVPYKITAVGKRAFQAWLKLTPSPDLLRSEAVLRVALGRLQEPEQLEELLDELAESHHKRVAEINALLNEAANEHMDYDYQALQFALMYHQMIIGWLEIVELPDAD